MVNISFVEDVFDDELTVWEEQHAYRRDLAPGAATWLNSTDGQVAGLCFVCPCGCGNIGHAAVRPGYGGSCWTWNGNREKPTLTPSIQKTSACRWHGFLTDGVFASV
jgi:hypothetical protein